MVFDVIHLFTFYVAVQFFKTLKKRFSLGFLGVVCVYAVFVCQGFHCVRFFCLFFWGWGGVTSFHCRRISGPLSRVILPGPDLPYPLGNSSWLPCQR